MIYIETEDYVFHFTVNTLIKCCPFRHSKFCEVAYLSVHFMISENYTRRFREFSCQLPAVIMDLLRGCSVPGPIFPMVRLLRLLFYFFRNYRGLLKKSKPFQYASNLVGKASLLGGTGVGKTPTRGRGRGQFFNFFKNIH